MSKKISYIIPCVTDLNGLLRGKRDRYEKIETIQKDGISMPISLLGVDVFGNDVADPRSLVLERGDRDAVFQYAGNSFISIDKRKQYYQYFPLIAFEEEAQAYYADPRQFLSLMIDKIVQKYNYKIVCAVELEFFVREKNQTIDKDRNGILSVQELKDYQSFLDQVYELCDLNKIPVTASSSENGHGQFEINIKHSDNILKVVDQAQFFKQIVKDVAELHDLHATFMAKPYTEVSGSGMHIHLSFYDEDGNNVLQSSDVSRKDLFDFFVGGLVDRLATTSLIFLPTFNSYKRIQFSSLSPNRIAWGFDNRTAAVRVIDSQLKSCRIEHRVSGADANPYLVVGYLLASILYGVENQIVPPKELSGNIYDHENIKTIPSHWSDAFQLFQNDDQIDTIIPPILKQIYVSLKEQELNYFSQFVFPTEYNFFSQNF